MLSRKQLLSAMAGLAMLAMPVSALAKHHDDGSNPRPYAWHDQGRHNGWAKHQFAAAAPVALARPYYAKPRIARTWDGPNYNQRASRYWATPQPIGYHRACDNDGDDCGLAPNRPANYWQPGWDRNYHCGADGDDCHWNNNYGPQYWQNNGGYDYGAPYSWYEAQPPANSSLAQQRTWLITRRQRAMGIIARMRARGDSRGAARMVSVVNALDTRIASLNRQLGYSPYSGYAPTADYGPAANYPTSPLSSLLTGATPYYGNANYGNSNPYYGNTSYGDPTTNALVSVLPLLLGPH
ncbi:MAG: hypothetical protein ACREQC_08555 [Candidatus Binataceae bacterium]